MLIPLAAATGLAIGVGLWKLAEIDNAREAVEAAKTAAEEINAVGGVDSPWTKVEIPESATGYSEFWDSLDPDYSKELIEAATIEQRVEQWDSIHSQVSPDEIATLPDDKWLSLYEVKPVSQQVSAASPAVSSPVSSRLHMTPESQVQPAVEVVATTPQTTSCSDGAVEWLQANAQAFPVPIPPTLVECYADRQSLIKAAAWVSKAIDAGVSQNKVVTVVFGSAKGTANYQRIVDLYKEVKGHE